MSALPEAPDRPDWRALLRAAVAFNARGTAGVAEVLGISRTAVSMVLHDKYPASTKRIAELVLEAYDRVACPHLQALIVVRQCRAYALRPVPTTSAREMRHWRACQRCPMKPEPTKGET